MVSDGEETVEKTFEVTLSNYARTPINTQWDDEWYATLSRSTGRVAMAIDGAAAPNKPIDNTLSYLITHKGDVSLWRETHDGSNSSGRSLEIFVLPSIEFSQDQVYELDLNSDDRLDYIFVKPDTGRVQVFLDDPNDPKDSERNKVFVEAGQFTIPGACEVSGAIVGTPELEFANGMPTNATPWTGLLIGSDTGLTALINEAQIVQPLGQLSNLPIPAEAGQFTRSIELSFGGSFFCWLEPISIDLSALVGFDPLRSEIVEIAETIGDAFSFGNSIPVPTPEGTTLVDMKVGETEAGARLYVLLYSSGTHEGPHQVTIVLEGGVEPLEFLEIPLPNGAPENLYFEPTTSLPKQDILITVPETPYIYVIRNTSDDQTPLNFGEIEFFDVGFGVTEIHQTISSTAIPVRELHTNTGDELNSYRQNSE